MLLIQHHSNEKGDLKCVKFDIEFARVAKLLHEGRVVGFDIIKKGIKISVFFSQQVTQTEILNLWTLLKDYAIKNKSKCK